METQTTPENISLIEYSVVLVEAVPASTGKPSPLPSDSVLTSYLMLEWGSWWRAWWRYIVHLQESKQHFSIFPTLWLLTNFLQIYIYALETAYDRHTRVDLKKHVQSSCCWRSSQLCKRATNEKRKIETFRHETGVDLWVIDFDTYLDPLQICHGVPKW